MVYKPFLLRKSLTHLRICKSRLIIFDHVIFFNSLTVSPVIAKISSSQCWIPWEYLFCKEKKKMALRFNLRNISTFRPLLDSLRDPLAANAGSAAAHDGTAKLWKKIFFFICVPSMALCAVHVALLEEHERPEFRPYEHLRLRAKKYPWGDGNHSLFHNRHTNALPDGYED